MHLHHPACFRVDLGTHPRCVSALMQSGAQPLGPHAPPAGLTSHATYMIERALHTWYQPAVTTSSPVTSSTEVVLGTSSGRSAAHDRPVVRLQSIGGWGSKGKNLAWATQTLIGQARRESGQARVPGGR